MAVSIVGLDKAEVLCVLYNASLSGGMALMSYKPEPMQKAEAEKILAQTKHFDYLKGRLMKLSLERDDFFDEWGYDRDNGQGAAEQALALLRKTGDVNPPEIQRIHAAKMQREAKETKRQIGPDRMTHPAPGVAALEMGLPDEIGPLADKILEQGPRTGTKAPPGK